jgi:hypothetical protein
MPLFDTTYLPRIRQGDILKDIGLTLAIPVSEGEIEVVEDVMSYCVVLTQECDLEQDYSTYLDSSKPRDKILPSILFCPAFPAQLVKEGSHVDGFQRIGSDVMKRIRSNNDARYHCIPEDQALQIPELVVDFKRYYTMPRQLAYKIDLKLNRLASLGDLFREHLSHRFAYYLSRVGLPEG